VDEYRHVRLQDAVAEDSDLPLVLEALQQTHIGMCVYSTAPPEVRARDALTSAGWKPALLARADAHRYVRPQDAVAEDSDLPLVLEALQQTHIGMCVYSTAPTRGEGAGRPHISRLEASATSARPQPIAAFPAFQFSVGSQCNFLLECAASPVWVRWCCFCGSLGENGRPSFSMAGLPGIVLSLFDDQSSVVDHERRLQGAVLLSQEVDPEGLAAVGGDVERSLHVGASFVKIGVGSQGGQYAV
jgi:hypothetical protein